MLREGCGTGYFRPAAEVAPPSCPLWVDVRRRLASPTGSAMRAPRPTTGTALAFAEVGAAPIDALAPGLRLLCGLDPADPFVAGERRYILPRRERVRIALQRVFEITGEFMDDPAGDLSPVSHRQPRRAHARPKSLPDRARGVECLQRVESCSAATQALTSTRSVAIRRRSASRRGRVS